MIRFPQNALRKQTSRLSHTHAAYVTPDMPVMINALVTMAGTESIPDS